MTSAKVKKNRIIIGTLLIGISLGIGYTLWGGLEENMVYFVTPSELQAKGNKAISQSVRLGGIVVPGSIHQEDNRLTFRLKDEQSGDVAVLTTKTPPQMFQEDIGVVVEGSLQENGVFLAERLMVKHGNEYRPPEDGQMPEQVYKNLNQN